MNAKKSALFHSNGNLLIAGEYFVLAGARSLAVPLKSGQLMEVKSTLNDQDTICWKALEQGRSWFTAQFQTGSLNLIETDDQKKSIFLQHILHIIRKERPQLFQKKLSYNITCDTRFNSNWGWGSSATLIANLAHWADIDPFSLNRQVSSGSGYDIAAAISPAPIFYQKSQDKPLIEAIEFKPPFLSYVYFIYLGQKQNTTASIAQYFDIIQKNSQLIGEISELSYLMAFEKNLQQFMKWVSEHERIISKTVQLQRVKELYFSDFEGEIKSLGAWGGDFAMVVTPLEEPWVRNYFKDKNIETLFTFTEIIKHQDE